MANKKTNFVRGLSTRAIHPTRIKQEESQPVVSPIYLSTTFDVKENLLRGKAVNYFYSRMGNPTVNELEEKLASLENGVKAKCLASGMSAISTTLLTLTRTGDEIITDHEVYGGTMGLFSEVLPNYGIKVNFVDLTKPEEINSLINDKTKVIFLETPANPTLKIINLSEIAEIAEKKHLYSIVDNTFSSPIITRPLESGIDFVIHSLTKFIGGHGDAIGGVVITKQEHIKEMTKIEKFATKLGPALSPFNAYLFLRGLKTLEIRVKQHSHNAIEVAKVLENRKDRIEKVLYPGLPSHPQHELAKKQMEMFGGLLSFYLKKDYEVTKFMENLQIPCYAVSLGSAETLVEDPYNLTHFSVSHKIKKLIGVTKNLIRVSVGLENVEDLIDDFNNSLDLL